MDTPESVPSPLCVVSTAPSKKKRLKTTHKVLIVIGVFLLLPVVAWLILNGMADAAVRRELAKIEQAGGSVDWRDLAPPWVPDEENAALVYNQAFRLIDEDGSDTENSYAHALYEDSPWDENKRKKIAEGFYWISIPLAEVSEEAAWQAADERLQRNEKALNLIRSAAAMERCQFDINYAAAISVSLPHLPRLREGVRLLLLSAQQKRRQGDFAGAYRDVLTVLRLQRATRQPNVDCYLVGNLTIGQGLKRLRKILSTDTDHPQQWRRFLGEVDNIDLQPCLVSALQGERASGVWAFGAYRGDPSQVFGLGPFKRVKGVVGLVLRPMIRFDEARYLSHMSEMVAAARLPAGKALAAAQSLEKQLDSTPRWAILTKIFAAGRAPAFVSQARNEADLALAQVALGLKLYKHSHGAYPKDLAALAPDILKTVPDDPLTGKSFIYARTDDGFVVYSVGCDLVDNGGNEKPPNEDEKDKGVDIVWDAEK